MGTDLFMITNAKLRGDETQRDWELYLKKFKALEIEHNHIRDKGKTTSQWSFSIEDVPDMPFCVNFNSPYIYYPNLYPQLGEIHCLYRYEMLYRFHDLKWLDAVRLDFYNLVKAMGGTEGIYLADNSCDKLNQYLDMAWEGVSYQKIKQRMFNEMGPPVTDYAKLNYENLDYHNIKEYFLDDFSDLK